MNWGGAGCFGAGPALGMAGSSTASWVAFTGTGKAGIEQRAGPSAVKIGLAKECDGQGGSPGFSVAAQAQVAQNGVELFQLAGMEVNGQRHGAGERISSNWPCASI